MGTTRRQYMDEFKREALELLVSSGRPLSQIAGELGIPPERLRAWRNRSGGSNAGSPPELRRSLACTNIIENDGSALGRRGHAGSRNVSTTHMGIHASRGSYWGHIGISPLFSVSQV